MGTSEPSSRDREANEAQEPGEWEGRWKGSLGVWGSNREQTKAKAKKGHGHSGLRLRNEALWGRKETEAEAGYK